MPPDKPRTRDGYTRVETEVVKSALLSVAVTLSAYTDDLCVIGGLGIDFMLPPTSASERPGRIRKLEPDFGALVTRGLELAFDERLPVALRGTTLKGEQVERLVPVCGPGALVVLKSFAFGDRGEPKDAFDLAYVLREWPAGVDGVADRLADHAERHRAVVDDALAILRRDFATIDTVGSRRVAEFEGATDDAADEVAADARGAVDDLLAACAERGLGMPPHAPPAVRGQSSA